MEGMSRVRSSGEGTQLSEGGCCTGDACKGVWWEHPVNIVVIATKLLVRVTILLAREVRSITRVTRLIFRVTGLMIKPSGVTRVTRVTGSYRVSKFFVSPIHHISVGVAVMLGKRKGLSSWNFESASNHFFPHQMGNTFGGLLVEILFVDKWEILLVELSDVEDAQIVPHNKFCWLGLKR